MFRTTTMMSPLNGFAGTHVSSGTPGSGNGMLNGIAGLNLMLNGSVGIHIPTAVPGQGTGTMMGISAGVFGLEIGGTMPFIIQDILNGKADASATAQSIAQAMLNSMDDLPGIHLVGLAHMNLFESIAA